MRSSHAALLQKINETGAYDDEIESQLKAAVEEFKHSGRLVNESLLLKHNWLRLIKGRSEIWLEQKRFVQKLRVLKTRKKLRVRWKWLLQVKCVKRKNECAHQSLMQQNL